MRPLSGAVPKEMLPFGRYPLVEHAVAELAASGVGEICVVIGPGKEVVRTYLEGRRETFLPSRIVFAFQEEPRGLGDALRCAAAAVGGRALLMVIPDQLLLADAPAAAQLLAAGERGGEVWHSLVSIPAGEEGFFPGARPLACRRDSEGRLAVTGIGTEGTAATRGFGRTLFPPEAVTYMTGDYVNPDTGEVDLLLTARALLRDVPSYALVLEGVPCDFGTWEGYLRYQGRHGASARASLPAPGGQVL